MVAPLLLLMLVGIMEYGLIFLRAQQITHAARHGARVGARADATNGEIESAVAAWCGNPAVHMDPCVVHIDVDDVATLAVGELLTVTVTSTDIKVGVTLVPTPDSFSATVTMAKEGP